MAAQLDTKLESIGRVLDRKAVLALDPEKKDVQEYYRVNKIPYSLFHTKTDLMYMAISRDGIYKEDDLLNHARLVASYIEKLHATDVLELATGRGANSFYLAKRFPGVRFKGIDLSPAQLSRAYMKARQVTNYHPAQGDYHDLSRFKDGSFDVVFVVEALCYSTDKAQVMREVSRVLRPGGVFIVFDGYLKKEPAELSAEEREAAALTEKGMALKYFETYASFLEKTRSVPLAVEHEEDLSFQIMPTLRRFERLGRMYFTHPFLARLAARIFSPLFINNTVSGYLMPDLIEKGVYCYMLTVLQK